MQVITDEIHKKGLSLDFMYPLTIIIQEAHNNSNKKDMCFIFIVFVARHEPINN